MKRLFTLCAALAALAFATLPVRAAGLVEGTHYTVLQMPQPTEQAGKVEVIEFFWFGCPHCADFEPLVRAWVKKLPADVSFRKVPAVFNPTWAAGARLFYTLESMGLTEKLTPVVFDAMVKQRIRLWEDATLLDWVAKQGIDRQKFADMYKSFAVDAKVKRAAELTQEYGFDGVPALVVGGKYLVGPTLDFPSKLRAADALIEKNRAEIRK